MKTWMLIFTDAKAPVVSARVAAEDREHAVAIVRDAVYLEGVPPDSILCSFLGKIESDEPGVFHVVNRIGWVGHEARIT